jgi:hypothetical protein
MTFLEDMGENHDKPASIAGVSAKIRTGPLLNKSQESYRDSNQLNGIYCLPRT